MSGATLRALPGAVAMLCAWAPLSAASPVDVGQGNGIAALAQSAADAGTWAFLDRLHARAGRNEPAGPTAGTRAFWSVYGDRARWDDAARTRRWGLSAGVLTDIDDGFSAGLTMAAGSGSLESMTSVTSSRGTTDEYLAAVHVRMGASSQPLHLTVAAGHAWIVNDFTRDAASLGTLAARGVAARQVFASAALSHDTRPIEGLALTGFVRMDAARLEQDGYSEVRLDGASFSPSSVDAAAATALRSLVGVRAALAMATGRRGATLSVHAAWSHEFETDRSVRFTQERIDSSGSPPTIVSGIATSSSPDHNGIRAGASVEAPVTDAARIFLGYNALFASSRDSQSAEAGLRVTW